MALHTGDHVRAMNRRGAVVIGTLIDFWPLNAGGVCVKVKPDDGGPPRVLAVDTVDILECRGHTTE